MKIKDILAKKYKFDLTAPLKVAIGTVTSTEIVVVKVETDEDIYGFGEAAGITFVTGETNDTVMEAIKLLRKDLIGIDPLAIEHVHKIMDRAIVGNSSAKAAIDIALYDIMGKNAKVPLYKLLGGVNNKIITDMTIGIDNPDKMAESAKEIVSLGFKHIKVKAGLNPKDDIEAIKKIREAIGPSIHLKMDANQGWSKGDCLYVIKNIEDYDVEAIEQPVPYWDLDGLAYVRSKASIMIMADESCFSPYDALKLVKHDAVDLINIKLMKCGGLYRAMQINTISESAGVKCMLGCMMESKISITAAAALVASRENIIYGDLDSFLAIKECDFIKGGFKFSEGEITLSEGYGLGIEVDF